MELAQEQKASRGYQSTDNCEQWGRVRVHWYNYHPSRHISLELARFNLGKAGTISEIHPMICGDLIVILQPVAVASQVELV